MYYGGPGTAQAPATVDTTGVEEHDGFYLRLTLGPVYLTTSGNARDFSARGGGLCFSAAIGGAVATNLVVFGVLYGAGAAGPTLEDGGTTTDTDAGTSLSYGGLGAGLSYFIMPVNMYLSASVAFVSTEIPSDAGDVLQVSEVGLGARLLVGKEFWVGDDWGIGFAGELLLGTSKGELRGATIDTDVRFTTFGVGVHFSATYN